MLPPDQRVNRSKPKTNAYKSQARPPNTNHKQVCSGKDTPPQPELTLCVRDAEPKVVQGGAAGEQALETRPKLIPSRSDSSVQ